MKKFFRNILLLVAVATASATALSAQLLEEGNYISIKSKYSFNLPTLGVSFNMPKSMGFRPTMNKRLKTFLSLEDKAVNYFFDKDTYYDNYNPIIFQFAHPGTSTDAMLLNFIGTEENPIDVLLEEVTKQDGVKVLPSIKTKIGEAKGFEIAQENEPTIEVYVLFHDSFVYIFTITSANDKVCRNIIKSMRKKDFTKELQAYQQKIDNGDFDEEEEYYDEDYEEYEGNYDYDEEDDCYEDGYDAEDYEYEEEEYLERVLSDYTLHEANQPMIIRLYNLGLNFNVPKNVELTFNAASVSGPESEPVIDLTLDDLTAKTILFFTLQGKDKKPLFATYRIWKNMDSPDEMVDRDIQTQKVVKKFSLNIDGVLFKAVAVGSNEFPSINAYAQLGDYALALMFNSVEKDQLPEVEELLAGITFSSEQKEGAVKADGKVKPLSQQLTIKERKIIPLKQLTYARPSSNREDLVTYTFTEYGISCKLPRGDYEMGNPDDNFVSVSDTERRMEGEFSKYNFLSVSSSKFDPMEQYAVSIHNYKPESLEDFMDMFIKNWSTYKGMKVIQTGIGTVNGTKWGLMTVERDGTIMPMYTALYKDMYIMFSGYFASEDKVPSCEELLYYFTFE